MIPYTESLILEQVECIGGTIPNKGKYLIVGVQSKKDAFNVFDDRFYVFDGPLLKHVSSGTTNAGKTALLFFENYNLSGAAIWKTNMFYKGLYKPGYHKGRMRALRQQKPIYYYRDFDKDMLCEEQGKLFFDNIYGNMHGVDYNPYSTITKNEINGWSFACQVWNKMGDYRQMINAVWKRNQTVDYALLKEF